MHTRTVRPSLKRNPTTSSPAVSGWVSLEYIRRHASFIQPLNAPYGVESIAPLKKNKPALAGVREGVRCGGGHKLQGWEGASRSTFQRRRCEAVDYGWILFCYLST